MEQGSFPSCSLGMYPRLSQKLRRLDSGAWKHDVALGSRGGVGKYNVCLMGLKRFCSLCPASTEPTTSVLRNLCLSTTTLTYEYSVDEPPWHQARTLLSRRLDFSEAIWTSSICLAVITQRFAAFGFLACSRKSQGHLTKPWALNHKTASCSRGSTLCPHESSSGWSPACSFSTKSMLYC